MCLASAASTLQPGACVYWSKRSTSSNDATSCFVVRSPAAECVCVGGDGQFLQTFHLSTCPVPKLNAVHRSEAHAAHEAVADAALAVRPTIELCVQAKLGAALANVSVNTLEEPKAGATDQGEAETNKARGGGYSGGGDGGGGGGGTADLLSIGGVLRPGVFRPQLTLSTQSRRSVARMLRLLCTPVIYSSNPKSKNSMHANSERGTVTEADEHVDATRVTVASAPTVYKPSTAHSGSLSHCKTPKTVFAPRVLGGGAGGGGGDGGGGGGGLGGRFGKLTNFALLAGAPPKKKARVFPRF
jgi:uncharacterized membrane protein YgcG